MSGASVVRIRQKKYINRFFLSGAASSETAIIPREIGVRENFIFKRMVERGIFVSCDGGRYYLNEKITNNLKAIVEKREE